MKEVRCDSCNEIVIMLAKGSKIKPNVIVTHGKCLIDQMSDQVNDQVSDQVNGAERFRQQAKYQDGDIVDFFKGFGY